MSLTLFLGDATSNHLASVVEEAKNWLSKESRQVYFIVPNNIKFEMEFEVLNQWDETAEIKAMAPMQVLSFSRLAWQYLSLDDVKKESVSKTGLVMIVRYLLKTNADKMPSFRRDMDKKNFCETLTTTLMEFKNGGLTSQDVEEFLVAMQENNTLNEVTLQRLFDLQEIYPLFLQATKAFQTDSREEMDQLSQHFKQRELKNTLFIVYGFHHFNSDELLLLNTIMQKTKLLVSLVMPVKEERGHLFDSLEKTKRALLQCAKEEGVHCEIKRAQEKAILPSFGKAMNFFFRHDYNHESIEVPSLRDEHFLLYECDSPQGEVEAIARAINHLVKEEGYRYKEITIMTRGLVEYSQYLVPIFKRYHIPLNVSDSQSMKNHPLIEVIDTLFTLVNHPYHLQALMRLLKTELFVPHQSLEEGEEENRIWHDEVLYYRDLVDWTERFIKQTGCLAYEWYPTKAGEYFPFIPRSVIKLSSEEEMQLALATKKAEELRQFIMPIILEFKELVTTAETGHQFVYELYSFFIKHGLLKELQQWQKEAIDAGNLEEGRRHEQTWQSFIHLLDEYDLTQGAFSFDWPIFSETFLQGLQDEKYSTIPSTMDQVNMVDAIRQRGTKTKVMFFLGCQDGLLPSKIASRGMINDETITAINDFCKEKDPFKYIGLDEATQLNNETYYAYLAMLFAKERLYLTYATHDIEGHETILSPFVQKMKTHGLITKKIAAMPAYQTYDASYISEPAPTMALIVSVMRQAKDQFAYDDKGKVLVHPIWQEIAQQLMQENRDYRHLYHSLFYKNTPQFLQEATATALYQAREVEIENQKKKAMDVSVSKMETFYQCQYRYFLQYGLFLKEEEEYELDARVKGNFSHEVIEQVMRRLQARLKTQDKTLNELQSLSEKELVDITEEVIANLMASDSYQIFQQDGYMEYMQKTLADDLRHLIVALSEMTKDYPHFIASCQELSYGKNGLEPLSFNVNEEWQLFVSGKIDRIDFLQNENKENSFAIIDYKSHQKKVIMNDIFEGLALQLLTYIDIALHNKEKLLQQYVSEEAQTLNFGLTGLLPIKHIQKDYKKNCHHDIKSFYPIAGFYSSEHAPKGINQLFVNGKNKKNNTVQLNDQELDILLKNNERHYQKAAQSLVSGEILMNPYLEKNKTACQYCPFQSICQFDAQLDENHYHRLRQDIQTVDQLIQTIEEERP